MSIVSQHDALHVTVQHLSLLDLTELPVELSLFIGPPAVDVFSQCNTPDTRQVGQHVTWQGRHAGAGQIQLLQGAQSAENCRAQSLEFGVVREVKNLQALETHEAVWLDFLEVTQTTDG